MASSGRLPDRHPFSSWGIFYYAHLSGYEANIRKGRRLLPETFWDIWEIPDTDLREPEGNFRYIFIWESILKFPFKRAECKSILASENFEKKSETIHIKLHNLLKVCYNMQEYQSVLRYFPARSDLYGNTVMEKYFMPLPACCQRADSKVRAYDRGA